MIFVFRKLPGFFSPQEAETEKKAPICANPCFEIGLPNFPKGPLRPTKVGAHSEFWREPKRASACRPCTSHQDLYYMAPTLHVTPRSLLYGEQWTLHCTQQKRNQINGRSGCKTGRINLSAVCAPLDEMSLFSQTPIANSSVLRQGSSRLPILLFSLESGAPSCPMKRAWKHLAIAETFS